MSRTKSNGELLSSRIDRTEKLVQEIREGLKKINDKEASLRNCYDHLVEQIYDYTNNEKYNPTSRESLQNYANYLSAIQDYRDTFIQRIQQQILQPLSEYPALIKNTREVLQKSHSKEKKELEEKRRMDGQQFNQQYAQKVTRHANSLLQDQLRLFEENKLRDIQKSFQDLTLIQMSFHARALELSTKAHQQLLKIDRQRDLQEFEGQLPSVLSSSSSEQNLSSIRDEQPQPPTRVVRPQPRAASNDPLYATPSKPPRTPPEELSSTSESEDEE